MSNSKFSKLILFILLLNIVGATSMWGRHSQNMATSFNPRIGPGDIIQVSINESTKSNQNFKSQIDDNTTVTSDMWGRLRDLLSLANSKPINKITNTLANTFSNQNQESQMEGEGKITSQSDLESSLTVMVKKVLSNGNLYVEGNKTVLVNKEKQTVKLSGYIRPHDIVNNMIESSKIADAQITFDGKGAFDGVREPGFFQKIMHVLF